MIREIIEIDQAKCDGCGECVPSCAEGALRVEGGKLRLHAEAHCDGLGACLGACAKGALHIVKKEAPAFDDPVAHALPPPSEPKRDRAAEGHRGCPGSRPRALPISQPTSLPGLSILSEPPPPLTSYRGGSRLSHWPVQLHLVSPNAPELRGADLLLSADCVPFAYARFHEELLSDHRLLVGCPKLDDLQAYTEKLTDILRCAQPRRLRVVRMEVPCCSGLVTAARQALAASGPGTTLEVIIISIDGQRSPG